MNLEELQSFMISPIALSWSLVEGECLAVRSPARWLDAMQMFLDRDAKLVI